MDKFETVKHFVCQENANMTYGLNRNDAYEVGYINGIRAIYRFILSIDYEEG